MELVTRLHNAAPTEQDMDKCIQNIYGNALDDLTCEQLAIWLLGRAEEGAQATSRTQSLCPSNLVSSTHSPSSSLH